MFAPGKHEAEYERSQTTCILETPQEQIQKGPPAEPPPLKHHRKKMKKPSSNLHCVVT